MHAAVIVRINVGDSLFLVYAVKSKFLAVSIVGQADQAIEAGMNFVQLKGIVNATIELLVD